MTVPAFLWRGGFALRAVILGGCYGLCAGVLAVLDSGLPAVGAIVFVVVGSFCGIGNARRMTRYWPESAALSGDERVGVVSAARRGVRPAAPLADAVDAYRRGLHDAAQSARPLRWVFTVVLVVALGTALWDARYGSWGNLVASALYLAALILEVFWWPKRLSMLLARADRAASSSV